MKFYDLANQCYVATSIIGFSCSGYLLFFDGDERGFLRTILLIGWTILSGMAVLKMIGELIIERMIKRNVLGGIKKRLIEKVHQMINKKLSTTLYVILMAGMVMVKIGMPFLINGLS